MKQIGITLVLLLILASAPAFSQSFDDLSIRPGVGIGPVRVGMTLDQVTALLGRRHDAEGTEGDLKVYRWNLQGSQHTGLTAVPVLTVSVGAPGEGIGPVRLGMSTDDVIRAMGRAPSERQRLTNGDDFLVWVLSDQDPFGRQAWLVVFVDPRQGVDFIGTDSVTHRTPQGNTPGTSILELQAEFGALFRNQNLAFSGIGFLGIWYDQHGITGLYLPIDSEKRIIRIAVFKKG